MGDVFGPDGDALIARARAGEFDAIWASPPCKRFSVATPKSLADQHLDLVTPARAVLMEIGLPYVIENVIDAPIRPDLFLCGEMFDGLKILRHRHFEIDGFSVDQPIHAPMLAAMLLSLGADGGEIVATNRKAHGVKRSVPRWAFHTSQLLQALCNPCRRLMRRTLPVSFYLHGFQKKSTQLRP